MAQYSNFIPENTALPGTAGIGVYDSSGNRMGGVPLGCLAPPSLGEKQYSFGALADVHLQYETAQEDFARALQVMNSNEDILFTCICGDLTQYGNQEEMEDYRDFVAAHSAKPVYAITGNHDVPSAAVIEAYTGNPLYYSFRQGEDVFIMLGMQTDTAGAAFSTEELQWLYQTLEANRNRRCFLFEHLNPDNSSGNAFGIYHYDIWDGTEKTVFESLMHHYPNVLLFHGHTHLKFYLQYGSDTANYDSGMGCHSIHIPSLAIPRDGDITGQSSCRDVPAESEGYIVDVYENHVILKGRDFVKGEYLPVACYCLDTTLKPVEAGTYTDSTGTLLT